MRKILSALFIGLLLGLVPQSTFADTCQCPCNETAGYKVTINYNQHLQQMIANGKYDYANSDITTSNFQMQGSGHQNVMIELVHSGRDTTTEAVLKEFEARGLRAATLPELLALGATYPEKQREFPIVALGSVWRSLDGLRHVAYLGGWFGERKLGLYWYDSRWGGDCRFAAVRK